MRNSPRVTIAALLFFGLCLPAAMAKDNTFTGCLAGTDDNYVLRTSDGALYRLHSDKDLDEHTGNMVEVKGTLEQDKREKEAQVQSKAAENAGIEVL